MATAADWSTATMEMVLMIWLTMWALATLESLAEATCPAAAANSTGFGWLPPSLSTVMVT
jgi:hypothetical protein